MSSHFFWYQLLTTDLERSLAFFAGLFDCDVARSESDVPTYFMMAKGTESPLFGVVGVEPGEGARSHWIGFLMVPSLERAIEQTLEAGGLLHARSNEGEGDEPEGSDEPRFAIVTDPQGAVINLHDTVEGAAVSDDLPDVGRLAWIELLTSDRDGASAYYQELAGWEVGPAHPRGEEGLAHALFRDGRVFGLMRDLPAGSPVPPNWVFYLRVPNLEEAIERARALGGFMYEEPGDVEGGRRVLLMDPTGAPVALWASL